MSIEYRLIAEDEFSDWRTLVRRGFNEQAHPEDIKRLKNDRVELDRLFGAFDDDTLVGTGGTDSHLLTVPGGAQLPTAGIAYIGTAATHRRRGVLTGMMKTLLQQAQERQEPLAALWPSESSIYGRFGFGQATISENWEIDPTRASFVHMPEINGRLHFVDTEEAMRIMPKVWDRARVQRAGFVDRSQSRWQYNFFDAERLRGGWSGLFFVVYESEGEPHGYAAYRLKPVHPDDDPMNMQVVECVSDSDEAHAALWRLLLSIDLVETVTVENQPPDDPVWWMLADPRKLIRTAADGLMVRVIDPLKALESRGYSATGRLVLEVTDDFLPDAGGMFELDASEAETRCRQTSGQPDITMSATELGATYLGGISLAAMAGSGRIVEHTKEAVRLFDRMFLADRAPWCAHHF